MVGAFGYFADLPHLPLRPVPPTRRQRELYRLAYDEVHNNLELLRPGIRLSEIIASLTTRPRSSRAGLPVHHARRRDVRQVPPHHYGFSGPNFSHGTLEAGMVMCVESCMGAIGESMGVKLEPQVLVTDDGYELLSNFLFEEALLGG